MAASTCNEHHNLPEPLLRDPWTASPPRHTDRALGLAVCIRDGHELRKLLV